MYAAHAGLAIGAVGGRPRLPMLAALLAAYAPDVVKVILYNTGAGKETADLWSHSLPAVAVLASIAALWYGWRRADGAGALLLAALVVSHLAADLVFWRERLWPGSPEIGLRLATRSGWEFLLEAAVVLAGWGLYLRALPRERRASWAAWGMLGVLLAMQGAFVWILLVD